LWPEERLLTHESPAHPPGYENPLVFPLQPERRLHLLKKYLFSGANGFEIALDEPEAFELKAAWSR